MKKRSLLILVLSTLLIPVASSSQSLTDDTEKKLKPEILSTARAGVCPPLAEMETHKIRPREKLIQIPNRSLPLPIEEREGKIQTATEDSLRQLNAAWTGLAPTPLPTLSFEGVNNNDNTLYAGGPVLPPDTEGDIGKDYYIQSINLAFQIYDKVTGAPQLANPMPNNVFFAGFGGACETENDGDPIVLYDQEAERWVFSQFAITNQGHQCFAVSQTSDPMGAYWLYDFIVSPAIGGFNDYPKIGVWTDGYYMSINDFIGSPFVGAAAVAFEKDQMLVGASASAVKFTLPCGATCFFSLQPSHWEGDVPPAAGAPNTFAMAFDAQVWGTGGADGYRLWDFSVDWTNLPNSTFTSLGQINTTAFDAEFCGFSRNCIQQPGNPSLDPVGQFTMYRLQYRNFVNHETLVGNHSVDVNGASLAGVRWFELRRSGGGGWTLYQTGTYAPADGENRWMGSAAMDGEGNIALGYSVSSNATFPSIRYVTRMASDALGTMPGGEADCQIGGGSQTNSSNRWGDYSSMSVDPVDDCTFWYTNEYYETTSSFNFKTRICSFKLADCSCERGDTSGNQWFLPVAPNDGYVDGGMFDAGGTQIYLLWADLIEGVAGPGMARAGTISGMVKDWPNWQDPPLYDVLGTWSLDTQGNGTWSLTILPVGASGPPLGWAYGTFDDTANTFVGTWQICD